MLPALPALAVIVSGSIVERDKLYNTIAFSVAAALFFGLGIALFVYDPSQYREFMPERIIIGILGICWRSLIFAPSDFQRPKRHLHSSPYFWGSHT